jgi:hypothetical protein
MEIDYKKAAIAFILGNIFFIAGFMVSSWIVMNEYNKNTELQGQISELITYMDRQAENPNFCDDYDLELSIKLNEAGSTLTILEEKFGKTSPEILAHKANYSILELKHFFSIKSYIKKCGKNISTVLFFYSNEPDFLDDAETKGYIISKLKADKPVDIMVYSFDYDLDTSVINNLKDIYNIEQPNTALINEKTLLINFQDIDDLKPHL